MGAHMHLICAVVVPFDSLHPYSFDHSMHCAVKQIVHMKYFSRIAPLSNASQHMFSHMITAIVLHAPVICSVKSIFYRRMKHSELQKDGDTDCNPLVLMNKGTRKYSYTPEIV